MSDELSGRQARELRRLLGQSHEAEYELDLTGLDLAHSLASIDRMVERQRFRSEARSVVIRLDPATATSGETLFRPVGRHLLGLMRQTRIAKCRPLAGDKGAGFFVELAGRPQKPY